MTQMSTMSSDPDELGQALHVLVAGLHEVDQCVDREDDRQGVDQDL